MIILDHFVHTTRKEMSSSPPQPKIVKSILKNSSTKKERAGIKWDEANLDYNEANKSATMKIDEPPTPYNYVSDSEEDEESLEKVTDVNTLLNAALQEIPEDPKERKTASFAPDSTKDSDSKFASKRKQHYNEFEQMKEFKKKQCME